MDEMNAYELLVAEAKENQTRKILMILKECENLEEAIKKAEALLNNK